MKPILLDLPMPIKTPRLILRPPKIGDGAAVNAAILESISDLRRFMPWAKDKPSVSESEEFVRQAVANWILKKNEEPYLPLFIFDRTTEEFIGGTGYHHIDWDVPCIEMGYWIKNSRSGQGLMTEAVNALTRYAFKQLDVKRITITCDANNIRSKKIPERLNYPLEATLKSNRINLDNGKLSDTLIYAKFDLQGLPELDVIWG
jgi:RimJ/RimL family protein N-acetyltransferase